jgi:thiamine biosynthesis lipoprotein
MAPCKGPYPCTPGRGVVGSSPKIENDSHSHIFADHVYMSLSFFTVLAFQSVVLATTHAPTPVRVVRDTWAMGTRLLMVCEAPTHGEGEAATEIALREIERLERMLSTWNESSELSRVNVAAPGSPVAVSPELGGLLAEAESWAQRTGRAFDPSVGALVDAWGLRREGHQPDGSELAQALAVTGPKVLSFVDGGVIRHSAHGWLDAGAFGKGAALRSAALAGRGSEPRRLLLNLGGQLWAEAPADAPWSIDVAHPARRFEPVARLEVYGVSVATSGSSERPGHLLDPRSGLAVPAWGSVTVVSADAMAADVLATALYVMGPVAGLEWARVQPDVAALFLELTDGAIAVSWTAAMEQWLGKLPPGVASTFSVNPH